MGCIFARSLSRLHPRGTATGEVGKLSGFWLVGWLAGSRRSMHDGGLSWPLFVLFVPEFCLFVPPVCGVFLCLRPGCLCFCPCWLLSPAVAFDILGPHSAGRSSDSWQAAVGGPLLFFHLVSASGMGSVSLSSCRLFNVSIHRLAHCRKRQTQASASTGDTHQISSPALDCSRELHALSPNVHPPLCHMFINILKAAEG